MAAIDDAIKTLIKELQKVSGGTTRETTGAAAKPTAKDSEEVRRIQEEINELYDERLNKDSQSIKNARAAVKAANQQLEAFKKTLKAGEELTEADKERLKELTHAVEKQKEFVELTREAEDAASNLADSFAGIFSGADGVSIEKMLNPQAILSAAENMSKMLKAGVGFSEMSKKAAFAFTGAIVKEAIAVADLGVEFQRATGASADFAANIKGSYEEARQFGATAKDVNAAAQSLYTNFTDFSMASDATVKSLTTTGAALNKLGVSNDDFAKSIQLSTKALGMSATQAAANMEDLAGFASDLGVAPSELASQFANAGDMVAKLGSEGTKAFKDLAIAAKVTGMSIDSIVNLTNQFDTFEGAAGMAGKLNAALGGNFVNAMDLMMATNPAERFGMIRDSILDAGLSFDEMSYYQKNFYKESLGLKDVGELAALMSGDMDLVSGAVNQTSDEMIDAKKRAQELASMQDKLNMVLQSAIPIIEPLIDFVEGFTKKLTDNIETTKVVIGVLGGLLLIYKGVSSALKLQMFLAKRRLLLQGTSIAQTVTETTTKETQNIVDAQGNVIKSTTVTLTEKQNRANKRAGGIAGASAKQMLAFGAAILMIGAGVGLAALGVAQLVKSFKGLGDAAPYAVAGITIFSIAFGLMIAMLISLVAGPQAALTGAAVGVLLSVGGAILMMGGAIAIAAVGFSYLINSLAQLGTVSASLLLLPLILTGISASMMTFANPLTLAGIAMAIPLFLAMGSAATLMSNQTVTAFERITKAIIAVPTQKNIQFQTSMKTAAAAMTTAAVASTVMAGPAMVAGAITGATGGQKPYNVNITLELDGKELDKRTVKLMNGKASEAAAGRGGAI